MVRIVKEHMVRRNEILDAAQRLIATKGYEQMTIQDILDDLQIAKGTFYHYYRSKQALLEALIERLLEATEGLLTPVVYNPALSALEKLQQTFTLLSRWKTARKTFLIALLEVWYSDENVIVREKTRRAGMKQFIPFLTEIIRQGMQEGVLTVAFPQEVGGVIYYLLQGVGETIGEVLLTTDDSKEEQGERIRAILASYNDTLERVLGVPKGSLSLLDAEIANEWVMVLESAR